jgi:hypothetical protein
MLIQPLDRITIVMLSLHDVAEEASATKLGVMARVTILRSRVTNASGVTRSAGHVARTLAGATIVLPACAALTARLRGRSACGTLSLPGGIGGHLRRHRASSGIYAGVAGLLGSLSLNLRHERLGLAAMLSDLSQLVRRELAVAFGRSLLNGFNCGAVSSVLTTQKLKISHYDTLIIEND